MPYLLPPPHKADVVSRQLSARMSYSSSNPSRTSGSSLPRPETLNFLLVTQGRPSSQFLFLNTLRGHVIFIHDMTEKLQLLLQELSFIHLKLHLLVSVS